MDYREAAKDLIKYSLLCDGPIGNIHRDVSELSHGELAALIYLQKSDNGAFATDLMNQFNVKMPRISAMVNSLEKKGYIRRTPDKIDKRKSRIYLTESGREYTLRRQEEILEHVTWRLSMLGEEDTNGYISVMRHISQLIEPKSK